MLSFASKSPSRLRMVPWKIRDVALGVLCVATGVVVAALIGGLLGMLDMSVGTAAVVATAVLGCVMVATALWLGPVRHGASPGSLGLRSYPSGRHLLLAVVVLTGSLGFGQLYAVMMGVLGLEHLMPPDVAKEMRLEGVTYVVGGLVIVLWGPFAEELFFRAFVFGGLAGHLGSLGAMAASSVLFALAHIAIGAMIPAFVAGMLLAWLYWRTRSLWPCLLAHAAQNALALSFSRV